MPMKVRYTPGTDHTPTGSKANGRNTHKGSLNAGGFECNVADT